MNDRAALDRGEAHDSITQELISTCRNTMRFIKAHYEDGGRIVGGAPRELYDKCKDVVERATRIAKIQPVLTEDTQKS